MAGLDQHKAGHDEYVGLRHLSAFWEMFLLVSAIIGAAM
jgi:hypothetical protein